MADAESPRRRRFKWVQAIIGIAIFFAFIITAWYLTSPYFQEYVRGRLVAELEAVTGGRVELQNFRWRLSHLDFTATNLTIHGAEKEQEIPYMHFDRLEVRLKIISLLGREVGFRSIVAEHPVFHIVAYPNGTSNQPAPKVAQPSTQESVKELFDMQVQRLEVHNGEFIWNDRKIPLDFDASDMSAQMFFTAKRTYDGKVHVGKLDTKFQDFRPFGSIADAEFSFSQTELRFTSLKWESGNSHLQGTGTVKEFSQPRLDLNYDGWFDLKELAGIARVREVRGGTLELKGSGTYASVAGQFSSAGTMLAKGVDWYAPGLRLQNAELGGEFALNNRDFRLSNALARAFGGSARGELQVVNWSAPPAEVQRAQGDKTKWQRGKGSLRLSDLPLARVALLFSSRILPLDRMNLTGSTSGTVNFAWEVSPADLVADMALTANAPAGVSPQQLPVNGEVRGRYFARRQLLEVSQLNLATRETQVNANGEIGTYTANLKFNLASSDLNDIRPVLDAIEHNAEVPVKLHGRATCVGTVTGSLKQPQLAGHFEAADFDTIFKVRQTTASGTSSPGTSPVQTLHWDSLAADLQYSSNIFAARHASLRRGNTQIVFDFSAGLENGSFVEQSPISLQLKMANADLAQIQGLTGLDYPIAGDVDLTLQLAGTKADPQGTGNFLLTHAVLFGQAVTSVRSDVRFANGEARLSNITLVQSAARLTGNAAYNLHTTNFEFNLTGSNIDLAKIAKLQTARLSTAGELDFTVQGTGTRDKPVINAHVHVGKLVLNGELVGEFNADAVTHGADMQLVARSNFEHSQLAVDGTVHLRGDLPAVLTLRFDHLDVDPLLRAYLKGRITGHSSVAGTLAFHGPLKHPDHWTVVGDVNEFLANIQNVETRNDGPIHFVVADRLLTLDRLRLVGEGTDVTAGGTIQFFGKYEMNMHADGRVNLRIVETLNPDFRSGGYLTVQIGVGGTLETPVLNGEIDIHQGALSYTDVPSGLSDINGSLVFTQDRLEVQSLTARTGGGTLSLGGYINYGRRVNFHITALGQDIRLRYPPGMSATANADLRLTGSLSNAVLAGDITVTRFAVSPDFDFATYLVRAKESITAPNPKSLLNNLHFDVHIVTTPELQVQTSIAKASGDADLRLRGTGTHPTLLGRVNILEGEVSFNGTKFRLSRGDISFVNPVQIQPVLDLEATTRVRDYDISIGFHGSIDKLSTTYRSDPPLATQDIIALLAFGRTREDTALMPQNIPTFDEATSNAILSQALTSTSNNRVQKLFGVSRVKIDPQVGATENNPSGARLTIEQQVSGNITLTYITNVAQTSQQIIQAEYNVTRYVSLIAIRDQNGVVSFDVRIRHRKK